LTNIHNSKVSIESLGWQAGNPDPEDLVDSTGKNKKKKKTAQKNKD